MHCVLDSSAALAWILPGELTEPIRRLLDDIVASRATAPAFWLVEIANALLMAERHSRISALERARGMGLLSRVPVVLEGLTQDRVWKDASQLAATHGLTVYDGLYLEAAVRLAIPLASLDRNLVKAAVACGVTVLGR